MIGSLAVKAKETDGVGVGTDGMVEERDCADGVVVEEEVMVEEIDGMVEGRDRVVDGRDGVVMERDGTVEERDGIMVLLLRSEELQTRRRKCKLHAVALGPD